jgi:hypothetical protein
MFSFTFSVVTTAPDSEHGATHGEENFAIASDRSLRMDLEDSSDLDVMG